MLALIAADRRGFAVDQQIEHVRFGRAVDHGEILAVETGVEHADLERGGVAHRGLAWLEIDLHAPRAGKVAQARAEGVERIARRGEADAATQAHPLQPLQDLAVAALDFTEQRIEAREVAVLAVVVDHHAVETVDHRQDPRRIGFAKPAEGPRRVGEVETGATDARVLAQADWLVARGRGEALELIDRIEDDLVAVGDDLLDLVVGEGHAVGMSLAAELLPAELDLVQRG